VLSTNVLTMIGHGERSLEDFVGLLKHHSITTLVDIRCQDDISKHPEFLESPLRAKLEKEHISYHWAGRQLGKQRSFSGLEHTELPDALRGFAEYMQGTPFARAAIQLCSLAKQGRMAIFCSQLEPENCHRRLIADYLLLQGQQVIHIIDEKITREHILSSEARRESASLIYDHKLGKEK